MDDRQLILPCQDLSQAHFSLQQELFKHLKTKLVHLGKIKKTGGVSSAQLQIWFIYKHCHRNFVLFRTNFSIKTTSIPAIVRKNSHSYDWQFRT
jgi:hypothetical protein